MPYYRRLIDFLLLSLSMLCDIADPSDRLFYFLHLCLRLSDYLCDYCLMNFFVFGVLGWSCYLYTFDSLVRFYYRLLHQDLVYHMSKVIFYLDF